MTDKTDKEFELKLKSIGVVIGLLGICVLLMLIQILCPFVIIESQVEAIMISLDYVITLFVIMAGVMLVLVYITTKSYTTK